MTTYVERQEKQKIGEQRAAVIRLKNNRLGMNIFQVSWIMAFVAMIVVNWQLRFNYSQWPPAGVAPFDLLLPSVATLALLISSVIVMQALKVLRGGIVTGFLVNWRLAIGLGVLFLAIIVYEFLKCVRRRDGDTIWQYLSFDDGISLCTCHGNSRDHVPRLSAGKTGQLFRR